MKKTRSVAAIKALATKLTYEMLYQEQQLVEWDVCGLPEAEEVSEGYYKTRALQTMLEGLRDEVEEGGRNKMFLTHFEVGCFMDIRGLLELANKAYLSYTQRFQEMGIVLMVIV